MDRQTPDELLVTGVDREVVGRTALDIGAVVLEMRGTGDDLESVFARLTAKEVSGT